MLVFWQAPAALLNATNTMPIPPWRFEPGQTAYARPANPGRKVELIEPRMHTADCGIQCPHWLVRDSGGDNWIISQLELSSRPTSVRAGVVKLLQAAPEDAAK